MIYYSSYSYFKCIKISVICKSSSSLSLQVVGGGGGGRGGGIEIKDRNVMHFKRNNFSFFRISVFLTVIRTAVCLFLKILKSIGLISPITRNHTSNCYSK